MVWPTYKHFKTNPIASTTHDVNKFVNNLLESKHITRKQVLRWKLRCYNTPAVRAAEITKTKQHSLTTNSFFIDSPTYRLAKELSSLLKPVTVKSKHHVRNFSDFASSIAQELLQTDEVMVPFDVASYYSQKFKFNWPLNIAKQHRQSNAEYKFVNYRPNWRTWNLLKFNKF